MQHASDIGIDHRLQILPFSIGDGAAVSDAGVRHQHIQPTESINALFYRRFQVIRAPHIAGYRQEVAVWAGQALDLRCQRIQAISPPRQSADLIAFTRKSEGGRPADPA